MPTLHKTTIEIWSIENTDNMEIDAIAREAMDGSFICHKQKCIKLGSAKAPKEVISFFDVPGSPLERNRPKAKVGKKK